MKLVVLCVETDKEAQTDTKYIDKTIRQIYVVNNNIKIAYVYMNGKCNYDKKSVIKQIRRQYSGDFDEKHVVYCIDIDNMADADVIEQEYLLVKDKYNPQFIELLVAERQDVFDLVEAAGLDSEKIESFLTIVFKGCSSAAIEGQINKEFIKKHVKEDDELIFGLGKYKNKIDVLKNSGITLGNLRKYNYTQSLLKDIAEKNFWTLNFDNLCYLLSQLYGVSEDKIAIQGISFINRVTDRNLLNYILGDKKYYIESIMLEAKELNLSANDFKSLMYDESLDIEKRKEIIHKQKTPLAYGTALQVNSIFQYLLIENKITITPNSLYNLINNYPTISNAISQFISLNIENYAPDKLPLNAQVITCLANSTATINGIHIINSFIDEISKSKNLINVRSIENEGALCLIIEKCHKSLFKEDITHICRDDFNKAPMKLMQSYDMVDIFSKDLGNNRLAHLCIQYDASNKAKELIYKGAILDIDNDDFEFASKMANDVIANKFELADYLYERLIKFSIDKEKLYFSQMDYMPVNVVLKRLKEVGPVYCKLAENNQVTNDEMDFSNDICQSLISKDYASIRYGRRSNKGKDSLILKITA